jgi:hypothetical protein
MKPSPVYVDVTQREKLEEIFAVAIESNSPLPDDEDATIEYDEDVNLDIFLWSFLNWVGEKRRALEELCMRIRPGLLLFILRLKMNHRFNLMGDVH